MSDHAVYMVQRLDSESLPKIVETMIGLYDHTLAGLLLACEDADAKQFADGFPLTHYEVREAGNAKIIHRGSSESYSIFHGVLLPQETD
jgi:hypothetical protein